MRGLIEIALVLALAVSAAAPVQAGTRIQDHAITASAAIVMEGQNIRVNGDLHANGTVVLSGSVLVLGTAEGQGVQLGAGTSVARSISGAAPAQVPGVDLAGLRRQATRVRSGDQHFAGITVLPGITYVAGSAVIEGVFIGPGSVVAERSIHVRSGALFPVAVDLVAGERVILEGSRITTRGMLFGPAIQIMGNEISVTGVVAGREVVVRGTTITLTAAPSQFRLFGSLAPPAALTSPTILSPRGSVPELSRVIVIGTAPAGARVRVTIRSEATQREESTEVVADSQGHFTAMPNQPPGPGKTLRIIAVTVGPFGQTSAPAIVEVTVRESSR